MKNKYFSVLGLQRPLYTPLHEGAGEEIALQNLLPEAEEEEQTFELVFGTKLIFYFSF